MLQRRRNHNTFELRRIEFASRPDLAARCGIARAPAIIVVDEKRVRARLEEPRGSAEIQRALTAWLK